MRHPRIAQLLSNLLANALMHGSAERPIVVRASAGIDHFELSVANAGDPIPPATIRRLFQPVFRASTNAARPGLGLGLYIASEIARAHGGSLDVTSTPAETRFTFRMPAGAPPPPLVRRARREQRLARGPSRSPCSR
jgi:signal transduction histidine kinase